MEREGDKRKSTEAGGRGRGRGRGLRRTTTGEQPQQQQQQPRQPQQQSTLTPQRTGPTQPPRRPLETPAASGGNVWSKIVTTQSQITQETTTTISQATATTTTTTAWGKRTTSVTEMPPTKQQPVEVVKPKEPPKEAQTQRAEQPQQSTITSIEEPLQALEISEKMKNPPKPRERCNLGRDIRLFANHYSLLLARGFVVFQYDVTILKRFTNKENKIIEKEIKSKEITRKVFQALALIFVSLQNKLVYDFKKSLYCCERIPQVTQTEAYETIVNIENREYIIKLKEVNKIEICQDVNKILDQTSIQVLQLIYTHNFNYRYFNLQRSFFSEQGYRENLGFNVDLWKGFYASVRTSEDGYNVNFDVANSAFFNSRNVIDLVCEFYECREDQLSDKIRRDARNSFVDWLRQHGVKVKTRLGFTKKVDSFGPSSVEWKFDYKNTKITTFDYFKSIGITLKHPHLPTLCLGGDNYTPMELCVTTLQHQRKLTPKQTSDMIKMTAVPCYQRRRDIGEAMNNCKVNEDPILKQYGISTKLKMVELQGRVVGPPSLEYGGNKILNSSDIGTKGQWDNMNKRFVDVKELKSWIVINFGRYIKDNDVNGFIGSLIQTGQRHGLRIPDPIDVVKGMIDRDPRRSIESRLDKYKNVQFILCILPGTTKAYNYLKTIGDIERGLITQAIDENSITKQRGRYDRLASNICLKINAKLGGINFKLSRTEQLFRRYLEELYDGPLMIIGADVNHPTPGDQSERESIAAVVGSMDRDCAYYVGRISVQSQPKGKALETIHALSPLVRELLDEYYNVNRRHPKRIVYLRDGVSEGQFKTVGPYEMNQLRHACQSLSTAYKPGITYVVVQKRHHTRLFPMDKADESGRNANVPPGTMVDCKIVTPDLYDFYLCSHMGIQGTSKPCHYYILHDDNDFKMNQIVLLCHYLCHIYSRSTTSVSYPAPTYYADLLAARGRLYERRSSLPEERISSESIRLHQSNKNKMFFI